jgi:hypothetical protein
METMEDEIRVGPADGDGVVAGGALNVWRGVLGGGRRRCIPMSRWS